MFFVQPLTTSSIACIAFGSGATVFAGVVGLLTVLVMIAAVMYFFKFVLRRTAVYDRVDDGSDASKKATEQEKSMAEKLFEGSAPLSETYFTEDAELLGRGKFSVVHRTKRRADGQAVALKTIQVFEMATKERNECVNEIKLLQSMQHPHIITYLDCCMERNELTVVMELASHGDLAGLIRRKEPLGEPRVWRYLAQICEALAYMHERRVMHRDIKPANVFISGDDAEGDGVMKLGDLGLGRYFSSKTDVTHSTVGTPYYMSPECIQGGGYEFKSDIWSLGCLLYELATLRSPFYSDGLNFYMLGKRIMKGQFEPMGGVSAALVELVNCMLQVKAADRPSAAEVLAFARAARDSAGGGVTSGASDADAAAAGLALGGLALGEDGDGAAAPSQGG